MEQYFDIHMHTDNSDGACDVAFVLEEAQRQKVAILSITDHNSVGGYKLLKDPKIRNLFGGKIIPGVEITTTYNGQIVEVLGYGYDIETMQDILPKHVYTFREKQLREAEINLRAFKNAGVLMDETFEQTMSEHPEKLFDPNHKSSRHAFLAEVKRHPENARFFGSIEKMMTIDFTSFCRTMVFNPKSPIFADQSVLYPSFEKAVEIIHNCGGLAFLAHPMLYTDFLIQSLDTIIEKYALDGLECYYQTFNKEQVSFIKQKSEQHGLYVSGGSDFHGMEIRPNKIGFGPEHSRISVDIIQPWLSKVRFI